MTTLQAITSRFAVSQTDSGAMALSASRSDLPSFCRSLGMTTGAEVGVWKGAFSEAFCRAGLSWIAVDPWAPYAAYREKKNDQTLIDAAYQEACKRLTPFDCRLFRMSSRDAAAQVPNGSLDVVYIDGNHEAEFVREDIDLWTPKVRSGGILAGHDYRVPPSSKPFIQVKAAVDAYVTSAGINPWFVLKGDATPSFMWVVA